MAELFDSLSAAPVLRTFVKYLTAFCSRLEATSDVISCSAVEHVGMDVRTKFGYSICLTFLGIFEPLSL